MGRSAIRRGRSGGLRSPWLATWLQPLALAVIVLVGRPLAGPQPSDADEPWLLVAAAAVTLPGLVGAVVGGVATARRDPGGRRVRYQRLLDRVAPQSASSTPDLPPSVRAEIAVSVVGWFLLLAALDLGVTLVLLALPVGEWWRTLPALPVGVGMAAAILVLLLTVLWMAVALIRIAVRGDARAALTQVPQAVPRPDARMDPVFRVMLVALAVCLLGLATFGVPGTVLELAYDVDSPWLLGAFTSAPEGPGAVGAWWAVLRATSGMAVGGLAAVVVLSPVAFHRMVVAPRRRGSRS